MSSITDENGDLRKQIGWMNGIFQIFDRHRLWCLSGHHHKRLLRGAQYQVNPQYTTKAFMENAPAEAHKERPRISTESSQASYSSSSCSSTFSSLDFNKIAQPETPTKAPHSLDLRDVVKDSMYREARSLSIKPLGKDERRGTIMQHIDSPRPSSQHKELPRLSMDSKASSTNSRLDFLTQDPCKENENPCHSRTSSIVAKLMGLENFSDTICADESGPSPNKDFLSQLIATPQNQATYSQHVSQDNHASPSPRFHNATSVRKSNACSRFPIKPVQRQQDYSQGSPKTITHIRKAPTNELKLSSSVYGENGKRITKPKFQKSAKDLRAHNQTLEAREQLEDRIGDSNLSKWKDNRSSHQDPKMEGACTPQKVGSVFIMKKAKVMDKVRLPVPNQQGLQNSAHMQNPKDITSRDNNLKDPGRHLDRNIPGYKHKVENSTRPGRSFGMVSPRLQQNLLRIEGQYRPTTPSSHSDGAKRHYSGKVVEKSLQTRKQKLKAKDMQLSDYQLSEINSETRYSSYQNDMASAISESNNSQASQTEIEVTSLVHSVKVNAGQKENSESAYMEHMPAIEINAVMSEQPSPVSVLDETFYCEDSPSPVKKISTAFQDESPSPNEAEWPLDINHLTDITRSNHAHSLENFRNSVQEITLLTEPDKTDVDHSTLNHRYINKILLASGLLKDSSFISTTDQLLSSCHLINPDMFHILEQTEGLNGEVSGNNDRMQLIKKTERKLIFDMVGEILVWKITSGRLFTSAAKKKSKYGLLKELYLEMDRVCSIRTECNLDDGEDNMIRLLTADMVCRDDWVDYSSEVPALVLDIERLIFKELIKEVITGHYDRSLRHCRKLFSK